MKDATFSAARLLELYERISDAEDAIPRLRRFVLDLAVRGKLVEQDPTDEPAAELLKRIAKEKARLVESGEIRRPKVIPPVQRDERPFDEQQGWVWARLGGIAQITQGFAFSSGDYSNSPADGHPLIKIGDIGSNSPEVFIKGAIDENYLVQRGDLLLGLSGSIKCSIWQGPVALLNQRIARLRPVSSDLTNDWLFLIVNFSLGKWKAETSKLTVQNVKADQLNEAPIPLPPLAEQQRIVAKVDELMALCDQLEQARAGREAVRDRLTTASLARLTAPETDAETFQSHARFALQSLPTLTTRPDQIKTLRQTILNLAVRGKLVEQDAADEPASELLKRIAAEKARLAKAGEIRKPKLFAPIDEPLFHLPATWRWCRMREVTTDRGQTIPDQRFTYIDVSAINKEAGLIEAPTVLEPAEAPSRARKITRKGDVIYSCVRPYLLNVAVVVDDIKPSPIASTAFAIINGMGLVVPRYIWVVLRSPFIVSCVEDTQRGQAYPAINDADFAVLPFPLPPLAEQHRIVAKVDALMVLCDRLEAALSTADTTRARLLNALLHEALEPAASDMEAA